VTFVTSPCKRSGPCPRILSCPLFIVATTTVSAFCCPSLRGARYTAPQTNRTPPTTRRSRPPMESSNTIPIHPPTIALSPLTRPALPAKRHPTRPRTIFISIILFARNQSISLLLSVLFLPISADYVGWFRFRMKQ